MTNGPVEWVETEIEHGRLTGDENPRKLFDNWSSFTGNTRTRIQARLDLEVSRRDLREELGEITTVLDED